MDRIFLIDDEAPTRSMVAELLSSIGLRTQEFPSVEEFLRVYETGMGACVLTDLRMRGLSGADLVDELRKRGDDVPIVLMSAFADVPTVIRVMRMGSVDFWEKTGSPQELIDIVLRAVQKRQDSRRAGAEHADIRARIDTLTSREREILRLVAAGRLSKAIAAELDISVNTVEVHRSRIMKKLQAETVADVVRMALLAGA